MRAMQGMAVAFGMVVAAGCQSLDVGNLNAPALLGVLRASCDSPVDTEK